MSLGLKAISQYGIASLAGRALLPLIVATGPTIRGKASQVGTLNGEYQPTAELNGSYHRGVPNITGRMKRP